MNAGLSVDCEASAAASCIVLNKSVSAAAVFCLLTPQLKISKGPTLTLDATTRNVNGFPVTDHVDAHLLQLVAEHKRRRANLRLLVPKTEYAFSSDDHPLNLEKT